MWYWWYWCDFVQCGIGGIGVTWYLVQCGIGDIGVTWYNVILLVLVRGYSSIRVSHAGRRSACWVRSDETDWKTQLPPHMGQLLSYFTLTFLTKVILQVSAQQSSCCGALVTNQLSIQIFFGRPKNSVCEVLSSRASAVAGPQVH